MRAGFHKLMTYTVCCAWILCGMLCVRTAHTSEAVGAQTLPFDEDVRWSLQSLPSSIDNLDWRSLDRWYILTQVFDTLVTYDASQNLIAALAETWHVSSDRLTYTFKLRSDAKFSNGRALQANDVAYSLKRYLCVQKNALLAQAIQGADTLHTVDDSIAGIRVIDETNLELHLRFPLENIWSFLSMPFSGGIVAKESIDPATLKMHPPFITSGAYGIAEANPTHYRLIANRYYYRFTNNMPMTVGFYRHQDASEALNWFLAARTNFYSVLDPFQKVGAQALSRYHSIAYPYHRIGFLYLNAAHGILQKKEVRAAIRQSLAPSALAAWPNSWLHWDNNFFPIGTIGHISENINTAGGPLSKASLTESMELLLEEGVETNEVADLLRKRLAALGITLQCVYLPKHEIAERFSHGNFTMGFTSVGLPMVDHSLGLYLYFIENPPYFKDPTNRIHNFFQQLIRTNDVQERRNFLEAISQQIADDAVIVPVYHSAVRYVVSDNLDIAHLTMYRTDIQLANIRLQHTTDK